MVLHELEQILFEELGYANRPELVQPDQILWSGGRAIEGIDSALFLKNLPLAYFTRFAEFDPAQIQSLHKKVWSQSKAPLLFITLPHEIRVYNGYESTPLTGEELDAPSRLLQKLTGLTDHLTARQEIRRQLVDNHYERIYLETGAFWDTKEGRRINIQHRADRQLLNGMGQMRKQLTEAGLSNHLAYTLLGRSIFIRYLEDRGVLTADWIAQATNFAAHSYHEALTSRLTTYQLFDRLSHRFNGDLFPVERAEKEVNQQHLVLLLRFLNRENLETGQLSFLPFDFEYIPIELISHIYDSFIENQRAAGAYYTPLLLADFVLEETMGADVIRPEMTVLDPACGSGIFLVGAYRRLIQAWRQMRGDVTSAVLSQILQENIFGVDKNAEAVRIAAFSLYLEILNHLTNSQIQDETFRFPSLQKQNLLVSDFFQEETVDSFFAGRCFDRIIGNIPWGIGTLTKPAVQWLTKYSYTVGGKQAAPAFMLRVPQFCKDDGEIALLAPAKSTIFVTSDTHRSFREQFFSRYDVRAVVNFAALVYELFPGASSPAVAFFYSTQQPNFARKLVYGVPKPSSLSQHLQAIVLDTTEIKFLDREELLSFPQLWKIALWGTPRDAAFIERLQSIPQLYEQANKLDWVMGEGIQINGGDENPGPWLEGMHLLPSDQVRPYFLDMTASEIIKEKVFHRPRTPELTKAPLVLIQQSQCIASFSATDIAYRHTISGITADPKYEWLLLWLVAYINSPLAKYYHFLTSTRWAVERGNIIQREYEEMPLQLPHKDDPRLQKILGHLRSIKELLEQEDLFRQAEREATIKREEAAINALVYELFNLHPIEQQLVEDMLEYGIKFFEWSKQKKRKSRGAKPVQRPDEKMLQTYAEIFGRTATSLLRSKGKTLNATVYQNGAPLTVVTFDMVNAEKAQPVQVVTQADAMRRRLSELDTLLLEQKTPSMYVRRHVRIYEGNQISLIRPSEQRFWTQSQARTDADAFLAELIF
jgi:hypothetical protein